MDAGDQFSDAERFGDVVIGPRRQAGDLVVLTAARGEHEDVAVREGADLSTDLKAVHPGQAEIQHDDIWGETAGLLQRLGSGVGLGDGKTGAFEIGGHHLGQGFFIVDDQDPASGTIFRRCVGNHGCQYHPRAGGMRCF